MSGEWPIRKSCKRKSDFDGSCAHLEVREHPKKEDDDNKRASKPCLSFPKVIVICTTAGGFG